MKKSTSGFTIVELLIVIVVIAILAAISVVAYTGIQQRARDSKRTNDIAQIKKALLVYDALHGGVVRPGVTGYTKPAGEPAYGGFDVVNSDPIIKTASFIILAPLVGGFIAFLLSLWFLLSFRKDFLPIVAIAAVWETSAWIILVYMAQ